MRGIVFGIVIAVVGAACASGRQRGAVDTGHIANMPDTGVGSGDGSTGDAGVGGDGSAMHDDAGEGHDAGGGSMDGGTTMPDAFVAMPDAHVAMPDAFVAMPDAFVAMPDAFVPVDAYRDPCTGVICGSNASCAPPTYRCACNPGYTGDGFTCVPITMMGSRVLIFDDGTGASTAGAAAMALGLSPTTTFDATTFAAQFDGGGWNVVVIDSALNYVDPSITSRLLGHVASGGRALYAYWYFNSEPATASSLGVSLGASFTTVRAVYPDSASPGSLWAGIPTPLTLTDSVSDDGDEVNPISGTRGADFDFMGGSSAMAITMSGRVIVMGFMPYEANGPDNDFDGIQDMQELWQAELSYVLAH